MRTLEKIIEVFTAFFFAILLVTGGIIAGIQVEQRNVTNKLQSETVTKIAVVNLDEGIKTKDKQIFYAEKLMDFSNENFVMDNLEAARTGIENGTYAGYVIIPADFSEDATSLNTNPQKTTLTYALNPNLREDISVLTLSDIRDFQLYLNTNMSYMYVEAILDEFHTVQDSAVTIMDNDNKDLANLNSIDSQKLLSSLEYTPLKQVENNIDALDLSGEYSANQDLVASMQEAYKKFCDDGKTAFGLIKQDESLVTNQITALNTTMQAVDIVKDDTGTVVYQAGFDNVDSLLTTYNTNFSNQKDVIREKLGLTASGTSPTLLDNNVVQTEVDNSLSAISGRLTSSISTYNGTLSNQKTTINQKLEELKSDTDITSDDIDSIKTLVSDISTADASISSESIDMDSVLNTAFTNLMTEIDAMPSINTTQVKTIFDDEIMTSLSAEITAESNKIKTQADSTATELTTYTTRLAEFNPYTYYDETAINNHMNSFAGNISTIQEKSSETHTAYLD